MFKKALCAAAVAAASLAVAAPAQADTGSISNITPLGDDRFQATYSVAVTECDSYSGYCGGYGYAWQVGANEACNPYDYATRLTWVGEVMSADFPGSDTGTDTFYAKTVPFKLCLGVSHASRGRNSVAESVYSPPAPAAAAPKVPAPAASAPTPIPAASGAPAPAPVTAQANAGTDAKAVARCTYWSKQETKREKTYTSARSAYRKKRTAPRRRKMRIALQKLRTAEREAQKACA